MSSKAGSDSVGNNRFSDYFAGAARVMQEGVAVHSLLLGCGWKTHDVNPNEVWKSRFSHFNLKLVNLNTNPNEV